MTNEPAKGLEGTAALEACPFCGAHGEELGLTVSPNPPPADGKAEWGVQCYVCHVESPFYDTRAEVVAAWNRRSPPPPARLEQAVGIFTERRMAEIVGQEINRQTGRGSTYPIDCLALARAILALTAGQAGERPDYTKVREHIQHAHDVIQNMAVYFPEGSVGRDDAEVGMSFAKMAISGLAATQPPPAGAVEGGV